MASTVVRVNRDVEEGLAVAVIQAKTTYGHTEYRAQRAAGPRRPQQRFHYDSVLLGPQLLVQTHSSHPVRSWVLILKIMPGK